MTEKYNICLDNKEIFLKNFYNPTSRNNANRTCPNRIRLHSHLLVCAYEIRLESCKNTLSN